MFKKNTFPWEKTLWSNIWMKKRCNFRKNKNSSTRTTISLTDNDYLKLISYGHIIPSEKIILISYFDFDRKMHEIKILMLIFDLFSKEWVSFTLDLKYFNVIEAKKLKFEKNISVWHRKINKQIKSSLNELNFLVSVLKI